MNTFSPSQVIQIIENFEGLGLPSQGGLPGNGGFYIDSKGHWNFGYGYDITVNSQNYNPSSSGYWTNVLQNIGVPQSAISDAASAIALGSTGTTTAANNALTTALTSSQLATVEESGVYYYLDNTVLNTSLPSSLTSFLSSHGIQFNALPEGVQTALVDMYRKSGSDWD